MRLACFPSLSFSLSLCLFPSPTPLSALQFAKGQSLNQQSKQSRQRHKLNPLCLTVCAHWRPLSKPEGLSFSSFPYLFFFSSFTFSSSFLFAFSLYFVLTDLLWKPIEIQHFANCILFLNWRPLSSVFYLLKLHNTYANLPHIISTILLMSQVKLCVCEAV